MRDPYQTAGDNVQKGDVPLTPRERAHQRTQSFMRKTRYQLMIRNGMDPAQAARNVGVKIPPGSGLKPVEILKLVEKGESPKRL